MASIAELFQTAVRYHQAGNLARAEPLYRQVLQADPAHAEAHHLLGHLALQTGHYEAALGFFRQAVALNPTNTEAIISLGTVFFLQKQFAEAAACFRQALHLNPTLAVAHYNLGNVHAEQGQLAEAAECFRQTLRLNPHYADAHNNLGNIFAHHGQWTEAGRCFQQAIAINPNHAQAHNNLGNVFKEADQLDQALASFQRALAINPNHVDAYANMGNALIGLGQHAKAGDCYRQALRIDPGHKLALWNRCILRLQQGNLADGWADFEHRWVVPGIVARSLEKPRWDGSSLHNKTILVYAEQGLGDTIHFLRFLPLVKARGGTLLFECPAALFRLFTGTKGVDQLIPAGKPLPSFDVQIPLMSLPGIFGTTLATIPSENPYLVADPQHVHHWRQELARLALLNGEPTSNGLSSPTVAVGSALNKDVGPRFNIGIAWQADPNHPGFKLKSFPLKCFEALARVEKVRLVSVQVGPGTGELAAARFPVTDLGRRFDPNSLDDLAGALMNMDLVVTVDTAVAHLAGALGVPVWVALPYVACWRWLLDRSDSPWYPTLRLFRQKRLCAWDEVFERIANEVRDWCLHHSTSSSVFRTEAKRY